MDFENTDRRRETVYSKRLRAGRRRTYFFDVRRTRGNDYYVTLTESTRRFDGNGFARHKIFIYKEDFNRFLKELENAINYVKTELMPDYDYDEFTRRQEEWEAQQAALAEADSQGLNNPQPPQPEIEDEQSDEEENQDPPIQSEEDMTW